ncbi:glycoside hydrolase family 99-like domain-containing protein [Ileibacterium valens]|uniref:glycosyltransferase WbsX family protein n=1 Tax=Ileibacterium valens TaxID=1862668 RepID=UPI003511D036
MIKTIAFYLPQFYTFPENDEWWGEGFTEWTNVRKAKPLFKGHQMPEIPAENNYYDLSKPEVMEWQSRLAKEYGVDGFCYYHYWFKDGKQLLEKPVENMLRNKKVDIPFCLCWANEAWARTWDGNENSILMPQEYDEDYQSLKKHFDYLLPFFKDSRYIKENNKPLFIIYKPYLINDISKLMNCWNELAINEGFAGIFWGLQHTDNFNHEDLIKRFDMAIEFEPSYTANHEMRLKNEIKRIGLNNKKINSEIKNILYKIVYKLTPLPLIRNYDETWEFINNRVPKFKSMVPGAFVSWDNTPRKNGKGIVYHRATPLKFRSYMVERYNRAINIYGSKYLFINAWNEWAEGAHLEPDQRNGYGYLEALKEAQKIMNIQK